MRCTSSRLLARVAWLVFATTPTWVHAQQVFWEPDRGPLGVGKTSELTLVFDNCTPDGTVTLPDVEGLEFGPPSVTSQTNMMNFRVQRRHLLTYPVTATREGTVIIPAFSVATSEGSYTVPQARFEAGTAGVGQTGAAITDIIKSGLRLSRRTVWAGEIVDAEYTVAASPRYSVSVPAKPTWEPDALLREPFSDGERISTTIDSEQWPGLRFRTRFIAPNPGTHQLDPVELRVVVQTGPRTGFFGFSQPRVERFNVASEPLELVVRPLPEPAPDGFTGAIGLFEFESNVVPETARVGEPITWTLSLRGAGNWPSNLALPEREVSGDFEVVQPEVEQAMDDGRLFNGSLTEDAVLIPTQAGSYQLGPVTFTFFNTTTGEYETTTVPPVEIVVEPPTGTGGLTGPRPADEGPPAEPDPTPLTTHPSEAPEESPLPRNVPRPTPLPRDPLPVGGFGAVPSGVSSAWWLLVALLPPALGWLALAWRQLRRTDKARERHAARNAARKALQELQRTGRAPEAGDLVAWRSAVAKLWRLSRAAPTNEDLARAIVVLGQEDDVDLWLRLWQETEDHLFGSRRPLPSDWQQRADQALARVRIRSLAPRLPLRRRYWLPRWVMLTVLFVVPDITRDARAAAEFDPASEAYRAGDFADARSIWTEALADNPRDWTLHNNVGLAWAQEERWGEASAHWTAAFLLHPRDETVRANLRLALTRLGGLDPVIRRVLAGSRLDRVATWLSPGEWGWVFFGGAVFFASGLLAVIVGLYRRRLIRLWRRFGFALILVGLVASMSALTAQARYGPLARPTAGLVTRPVQLRSIPTELAEQQQTVPVAPGTVVVVTDSFLNWDRVQIGTTVTGWLRREAAVPFYRTNAAKSATGQLGR